MIRATAGTWLNYASTMAFQVVFAARFGAVADASAFVIVFGISVAATGVVNQAIRAVVLPRLFTADSVMVSRSLRLMIVITVGGAALAVGLLLLARPMGVALHQLLRSDEAGSTGLIRGGAAFAAAQILVTPLLTIVLAQGRRFVPALAPVLPSVGGIVMLVAQRHVTGAGVFAGLAMGSAVELVLLAALLKRAPLGDADSQNVAGWTLATLVLSVFLSSVQPLERVFASVHDPGGAAQLFYATRSLAVVQQLVLGGVLLAAISDWSSMIARDELERLARSVIRTTTITLVAVAFAAAIAIVAGRPLVAAVYEHGQFTASAAVSVTTLLLLALGGFCAESVGLVLTQVLLAARRNGYTLGIGVANVVLRIGLLVSLAQLWGAKGVAVAYSVSAGIILVPQALLARKVIGSTRAPAFGSRCVRDGIVVSVGTLTAAALAASIFGVSRPSLGVGIVCLSFASGAVLLRLDRRLVLRHA